MNTNIILATDSYKTSQWVQYPPGTEVVYSYIESRKGGRFDSIVWFGLQAFIKQYLLKPITMADIDLAEEIILSNGMPFNRKGWERIVEKHNGFLPIRIKAIPEGLRAETGRVLAVIENTDPEFFWVTSYIETAILRAAWYGSTVATISREIKDVLEEYMEVSCDNLDKLPFMLHDFGARGVSSGESAMLGGMGHLTSFQGTDTLEAQLGAKELYHKDGAGFSIPAMEHSTVTSWGALGEAESFANMLDNFGKQGALLAAVSDSYDLEFAVKEIWGRILKKRVIDSGSTVVVRPDSGKPVDVVMLTLRGLAENYGTTVNSKGYKVLNNVRVIQGDGIDKDSITEICNTMVEEGWSLDNIAFGMGGALLQHCDRDWGRWAMKCSAIRIGGEWRDVFKQPKTDMSKASKRGRFDNDELLSLVFENGVLVRDMMLDDVRENTKYKIK